MPRKFPKPFFRSARNCWFVQIGKEQIRLDPDEEKAMRLYHEIMADRGRVQPVPQNQVSDLTVIEVLDKYLVWCKQHRAARTFEWYDDHIKSFITHAKDVVTQPYAALKPFHVVEWADAHPDWSNAYRRGAIVAIQRPFNWAEELGYIAATSIKRIRKPQAQRREQRVSCEEWNKIKARYKEGDPFRELLEFAWETGCRPNEVRRIEFRHVELEQHRVVFPANEAKGKKHTRVIHMTPMAEEIIQRRLALQADGTLFRNKDGRPWTAMAMGCRFGRLKKHLGIRYAAYSIRHGFCQRLLEEGNDHLTVAALMGHANGKMVAEVYSHMNQADGHLRQALVKASAKIGA